MSVAPLRRVDSLWWTTKVSLTGEWLRYTFVVWSLPDGKTSGSMYRDHLEEAEVIKAARLIDQKLARR